MRIDQGGRSGQTPWSRPIEAVEQTFSEQMFDSRRVIRHRSSVGFVLAPEGKSVAGLSGELGGRSDCLVRLFGRPLWGRPSRVDPCRRGQ